MTLPIRGRHHDRRTVLRALAWVPAAAGWGAIGCRSSEDPVVVDAPDADGDGGSDTSVNTNGWASGGTKAMTMAALYPDPFAIAAPACSLGAASTEGPCTEQADRVRRDVSEGYGGLPMRLALRIVDAACAPVADAKVKIWHTEVRGAYSGDTPSTLCIADPRDAQRHFFRGVQLSDADGRVGFDSCFPGWYRGRAIHIHYTVSHGARSFTSQLYFDQALVDEVFTVHPEYAPFGLPDTSNDRDGVVAGGDLAQLTMATSKMPDGALLASKQIVLPG